MIAGIDSFKDENFKLMNNLIKNGVDVKAKEFRLMPHGFLSYNIPFSKGMTQAVPCIQQTKDAILELY